jgi:CHAP domain
MLNVVRPEVDDVYAWAQRTGQGDPAGSGPPLPGDLIVWDEHIGVVESVGADGTINTIEGNSSDKVSTRSYAPGTRPAIGYVRLG